MTPTVVFSNNLGRLKRHLRKASGPVRFINLTDTRDNLIISDYLRELPNAQELSRSDLLRKNRDEFRRKYIEFLGQINSRNHSVQWWAMLFTDKNPIFPDLYRNASYCLLIIELMRGQEDTLVVTSDSQDLLAQLKVWGGNTGVRVIGSVRTDFSWRELIKHYTPITFMYALWRAALYSFLSRKFRPRENHTEPHIVITSLSHPSSFSQPGKYRDAYFGPWLDHLEGTTAKTLVFALTVEHPRFQFQKLGDVQKGPKVIPIDSCLTLSGLACCSLKAAVRYVRPIKFVGPAEIDGIDLACLVQRTINKDSRSGNYLMALRIYYCAQHLAHIIQISRCVYPYENLSWEKMVLLGLRRRSSDISIIGYQHSSITKSHTTFLLENSESQTLPLPDKILTTGEVTRDWLVLAGNYADHMFEPACALRQTRNRSETVRPRSNDRKHILVALGTSQREYTQVLWLLEQVFTPENISSEYEVLVRPHPLIPIKPALTTNNLISSKCFTISTGLLEADIEWADIVLYASSTVGLEAVSMGIPAVFLDLDDLLDTDPMFDWDDFKWTATGPEELFNVLRSIEELTDDHFRSAQKRGREYSDKYLIPISDSALSAFSDKS